MQLFVDVAAWLTDAGHWQGRDGIPMRIVEHLGYSVSAVVVAILIALPVGLLIGHTNRGAFFAVNVANLGRSLPSLALLAILLPIALRLGLGAAFWPTFVALVLLALPPIITNAYAGVREVDRDVVEASRAMGMREAQILAAIEWPLALPVILGGIRTAAVQVVATATLGAYIAGGGLGRYIIDGFARGELDRVFVGALLVALLAIATEVGFGQLERRVVPVGARTGAADVSRAVAGRAPRAVEGPPI
jgi:osmoprotectant transport system permease protein